MTTGLSGLESTISYVRGQQTFLVKGQMVNIFSFEGHTMSVILNSAVVMQKQP
jgi:hypothetical protein